MSKKLSDPSTVPEPVPPDSFATPPASDSFSVPTPEQQVQLWVELADLLSGVVSRAATGGSAATPEDRDEVNKILSRLELAAESAPLWHTGVKESSELQHTIDQGKGKADEAERIRKKIQTYLNLGASDPATNEKNALAIEALNQQFTAALRLAQSGDTAERQLRHLHLWLWPLFTPDANPFLEVKDVYGQSKRANAGALAGTIVAPKTDAVAREMGLNPFVIDSWRDFRQPEVQPPRRRFRTSPLSSQPTTAPMVFGRNL